MTASSLRLALLSGGAALLLGVMPAAAHAEVFRSAVVVDRPAGVARRLADLEVDANARKALVEAFIAQRLSETLTRLRGDRVSTSLEPIESFIDDFMVVSKTDVDATHVRVTGEGDIDSAAIVMQLVSHKILSFGSNPPKVLLIPGTGTRTEAMQGIRGRMADTLGKAGITLLAGEATQAATPIRGPLNQAGVIAAGIDAGADFVAVIAYSTARAPSAVGGAVLDGTLQYTLIRPHDGVIIGEQVFTGRGSGGSEDLASRMVMDDLAPGVARGLAGRLAEAIFSNGQVIDPDVAAPTIRINVYARPSAAATNALVGVLRNEGVQVSLGSGNAALQVRGPRQPADQLIVDNDATIEELYDIFARAKFGQKNVLRASVFEYGDDHIGLEILDSTPPTAPPLPRPVAGVSIKAQASLGTQQQGQPVPQAAATAQGSLTAQAGAAPQPAQPVTAVGAKASASVDAPPLQFRLSAAFTQANRRGTPGR